MWPGIDLADLLDVLDIYEDGPGRYRARNVASDLPTMLGSQMLAQTVVAAERQVPGMAVQSMHTTFPRGGFADRPVDILVETVQSGRMLATVQVSFRQEGRENSRSLVMLTRDEPDFLRHATELPAGVPGPEECEPLPCALLPWDVRTAGGAGALAPDLAGPNRLDVWMRCPKAPGTTQMGRALVAHGAEGFLGPVAMRPYPMAEMERRGGRGTAVALNQTVTFHEPFSPHDWLLLRCESAYAGRSRMHGRIQVFTEGGSLVASVTADGLMRSAGKAPGDSE